MGIIDSHFQRLFASSFFFWKFFYSMRLTLNATPILVDDGISKTIGIINTVEAEVRNKTIIIVWRLRSRYRSFRKCSFPSLALSLSLSLSFAQELDRSSEGATTTSICSVPINRDRWIERKEGRRRGFGTLRLKWAINIVLYRFFDAGKDREKS